MIRHVVTFKFKSEDTASRARSASSLKEILEPLANRIPGVRSLEIGIDDRSVPGHWDAALVSVHDSAEALAAYQAHPEHIAALEAVADLVESKSVVDYRIQQAS